MTELDAKLLLGYEEVRLSQDQLRTYEMANFLLVTLHGSSKELWIFLSKQIPLE